MIDFSQFRGRDKHSALKTEQIGSVSGTGVQFVAVKLQWGKSDYGFSLHASPSSFTSYGIQTTDFLSYLGFERGACAFTQSRECFSKWISEDFNLQKFAEAFATSFTELEKAEKVLENCGYRLCQPEGWGYFSGKTGYDRRHGYGGYSSNDGHTSTKSETMKNVEDEFFHFALSWMEGVDVKGWTFHYRPKHPPLSPEFEVVMRYLNLNTFHECQFFDFEPCYWKFIPFKKRGDSLFNSNAETTHRWFDAHPKQFSEGIKSLLSAQALLDHFDMAFLPVEHEKKSRTEAQINRNIMRGEKTPGQKDKRYDFHVALSFAGTEREYAEKLATFISKAGYDVFYDDFYAEQLWGRNLADFFDEIYRKRSMYCVIFVSSEYCSRMWTSHERKSAQARGLEEKGKEYILPIKVDDSDLPGMPPTTGYLSLEKYGIEKIVDILIKKLKANDL